MIELIDQAKVKYKQGYLSGFKDAICIVRKKQEEPADFLEDTPYALGYSEGYVVMTALLEDASENRINKWLCKEFYKKHAETDSEDHYDEMIAIKYNIKK